MDHDWILHRRGFLQSAAGAAAGVFFTADSGEGPHAATAPAGLRILQPIDGAVLNRRHGQSVPGGLRIRVEGIAPADAPVTVNGAPAMRDGTRFFCDVVLRDKVTQIVAALPHPSSAPAHRVRVRWDMHSEPRYRFSIDDNSFFLRDVAQKGYASLFDCFYLAGLRDLHTKYGAKFVLNIYYTTGDGFALPQFPDRYKSQWRDASDWLKLAFHAYADKPDRPYQDAPVERLLADLDKVSDEIRRFAGEETYSPPTVIHWGMVRPEAFRALAQRGVRVLSGLFRRQGDAWDINYRLDAEHSEYLSRHEAWMDFDSGIVFSHIDLVANNTPVDQIVPTLEPLARDPNHAEIMDLFTHEQYFWPFYVRYVPDHFQRLEAAIRWVTEQGYKPVFFHEGFLGGPE